MFTFLILVIYRNYVPGFGKRKVLCEKVEEPKMFEEKGLEKMHEDMWKMP